MHRFEFDNTAAAESFLSAAVNAYRATSPKTLINRGYWVVVEVAYPVNGAWRLEHEATALGGVRFTGSID